MTNRRELEGIPTTFMVERTRNPYADRFDQASAPDELAGLLQTERARLMERIRADAPAFGGDSGTFTGVGMAREFSDLVDAAIARMFVLACAQVGVKPTLLPVAIIATGGYGRRELCPFSDIDITFLPAQDGDAQLDRVIRLMFTQLMDIFIARCGLEVGYAYRLLEDFGALDHKTVSGLLDARLIAGGERLFIQCEDAFWLGFNPTEFIFTKVEEREASLKRWGRFPRVVEPHLKEGPGGLRDVQTAVWLAQARRQCAAARARGERGLEMLVKEAGITPEEALRLGQAKEMLLRVRCALHAITGAERDALVVTRQEEVANALGYRAEGRTPAVERFMADLYGHLGLVRRLSAQVIHHVEQSRLILGIGIDCKRRHLVPANDALDSDDPVWLLWACELAQKYRLEWGEAMQRAAVALVEMRPLLPDARQGAQIFTRLLSASGRVYPTLQQMADLGILGWYLPEFAPVFDLIPYDPSHEYSIGQHTLLVIRNLEQLLLAENDTEERMEMRRVLEEMAHPEQLYLAALLHDIGKADPDSPHAEVGEIMALQICARLQWSPAATENVCFLVRHHLLMAETSRLRDLNQDVTIREFTQTVDDIDRLNMLYLLTFADTRAVGEGVWTPVKGRFLRDLWRRAMAVLSDEETLDVDDAALARARRRLMKDLSLENLPEAEVAEHIAAMPSAYLLNQPLNRIALHIEFVRRVRAGEPVVDFYDERNATHTELTVCTYDDPEPGLLAKIAGILCAADAQVHSAQVVTRITAQDRIALDTLWIDFKGRQLSPGKRREITQGLLSVLKRERGVQEIIADRSRKSSGGRLCAPETGSLSLVSLRQDAENGWSEVEMRGSDMQGLMYQACSALAALRWDIHSARLSSWRGEARAFFYVTGAEGGSEVEAARSLERILGELGKPAPV